MVSWPAPRKVRTWSLSVASVIWLSGDTMFWFVLMMRDMISLSSGAFEFGSCLLSTIRAASIIMIRRESFRSSFTRIGRYFKYPKMSLKSWRRLESVLKACRYALWSGVYEFCRESMLAPNPASPMMSSIDGPILFPLRHELLPPNLGEQ